MKNKKNGFTLFEMLVVISIISILTALVSVSFSIAQKKARDARRMQDMSAVQKAAEQYYSLNNYVYPLTSGVGVSWASNGQTVLEMFPSDPKSVGWSGYVYNAGTGTTYCACATMENVSNGNSAKGCIFNAPSTGGTGPFFCVKSQQ